MRKISAIPTILICLILLSSCTRYIVTPLPLPPEPALPVLTEEEARAFNDLVDEGVRSKLIQRDKLLRNDNETLRDIIRATH